MIFKAEIQVFDKQNKNYVFLDQNEIPEKLNKSAVEKSVKAYFESIGAISMTVIYSRYVLINGGHLAMETMVNYSMQEDESLEFYNLDFYSWINGVNGEIEGEG